MDSDIIYPNEITEDACCPGQKDDTCHWEMGALIRRG
ncbi:hypothetical protein LEMLEM_LOCUS6429, partial [Lemmus lemmus]